MIVVGLTGDIAAGKTTVADYCRMLFGAKIFDADSVVHNLYEQNERLIQEFREFYPKSVVDNKVDRNVLANYIFDFPGCILRLEQMVHPFVKKKMVDFIKKNYHAKTRLVVLDIPKLSALGAGRYCHAIINITSWKVVQRIRLNKRRNSFCQEFFLNQHGKKLLISRRISGCFAIRNSLSKQYLILSLISIMKHILYNKLSGYHCMN